MNIFFADCYTVESIKAKYRTLARQYHPDLGGDTDIMQQVNAAYLEALQSVDGVESHDEEGRPHRYRYDEARETEILNKIQELLSIVPPTVDVLLIGFWVWILKTTKEDTTTRERLKKAGAMWHFKRNCWFWRPDSLRHTGRGSKHSLSGLAAKYGCRSFSKDESAQLATA